MFERSDVALPKRLFTARRRLLSISIAMVSLLGHLVSRCQAAERAGWIVQAALRSEIDLNEKERASLLEAALRRDPKLPEAHWAQGEVSIAGQWLPLEAAAARAGDQASLKAYREFRSQVDATIKGQTRLAEYCRAHHLPAQERAHWTAVVALSANHAEARRRLEHVNVDGVWIEKQQIDREKKAERAAAEYFQKHGTRLAKLSNSLRDGSIPEEKVIAELATYRNPLVIPGLEQFFSSAGESGGFCTVATVASMPAPEASQSLVRHAVDFPVETVRIEAINRLKERDENSFVPTLLAALRTPLEKQDLIAITRENQMIWRQRISFETQDTKRITTFDRVFQFPEFVSAADAADSDWSQQAVSDGDREFNLLNSRIVARNNRIIEVLELTVGDPSMNESRFGNHTRSQKSLDDWWSWWNDRIESYPASPKAVLARSQIDYIPVLPASRRYECLAAGTPIWTETGPVAVDQIKIGDLVLTQNQRTGELKFSAVLATTTRAPEPLLNLKISGETIRATGGHPFWVAGKGWIKARSLKNGMGLHTANGVAVVESVEEEAEPTKTFNLVVDECHSYFVGSKRIFSHDNTVCEPVTHRVPGLHDETLALTKN